MRKSLTTKEIEDKKLSHLIPVKNNKDKNENKTKQKVDEYTSWTFPKEILSDNEEKVILTEAVVVAVETIINNHMFIFNDKIYLQEDEGSTGVRLTGILAEIIMILWCQELSNQLEKIGITNDLIPRYVDDITLLPTVVPPGWILASNKLEFVEHLVEEDMKVEDDLRTMTIIQQIANNISDNIQVTFDVPSNYSDGKISILDTKVGLNCKRE